MERNATALKLIYCITAHIPTYYCTCVLRVKYLFQIRSICVSINILIDLFVSFCAEPVAAAAAAAVGVDNKTIINMTFVNV
jgi:hypothetical protein